MELAKFNNLLESKTAKRKVMAGGAGGGFGKSSPQLGSVSTPDLRYATTRNSVERRIWSSRRKLLRNTHKSWTRHDSSASDTLVCQNTSGRRPFHIILSFHRTQKQTFLVNRQKKWASFCLNFDESHLNRINVLYW